MQIANDTVVTLRYRLFDADGALLEEGDAPLEYLHGGYQGIFPRIEDALHGKSVGDACDVTLEPADAFGEYDAGLVHVEPRSKFPADVNVGMQFEGESGESGDVVIYSVTEVADDSVVVDGNHPFSGQRLRFLCTVADVRPATREEIEHGHVHGAHGHSH
ncbi:MAG TPA: peptidylprolyl isomerase [Burkholderiales bacterium]|nr:peptidylprolyl isomerase [Burkholderiales bacterium]